MFWTFNILYIAALLSGYLIGQKHIIRIKMFSWTEKTTESLISILPLACVINCAMYFIDIFRSYGFATFDFVGLISQMSVGLKSPGVGYYLQQMRQATLDGSEVLGGHVFTVLSMVWAFARFPIMIFSVLYFKKMRLWGKFFAVLYLTMVVIFYISIGTNIQFLHILLAILLPVILRTFDLWYAGTIQKKDVILLAASLLAGILLMAGYFSWMSESRSSAYGYEISEYEVGGYSAQPSTPPPSEPPAPDSSSPSSPADIPDTETPTGFLKKLNNLWISGSSYLSQGYYGMSLALTKEWTPMFGLGNSKFVVNILSSHLRDIRPYTYQAKIEEYGWDSVKNWHSIYTWLANDVSFYGVVIVMFLIGMTFGMMFQDAIVTKNPLARASVFFYILMMLFIPCNNQIAQSNTTLFAFCALVLSWFLCGRTDCTASCTPVKEVCREPDVS